MTTLRNLNRAVQSAEFPSHEWAQAVREMLNEIAERMEPASEPAKVECPNCGQPGEHYHSGDMPHVPAFYTCQPAQPEPAAPVGEMPEAVRLAIYHLRVDAETYRNRMQEECAAANKRTAAALETFWREHATPPKVAMTEELREVLEFAASRHKDANSDTRVLWNPEYLVAVGKAIAAVRAQAAGVKP